MNQLKTVMETVVVQPESNISSWEEFEKRILDFDPYSIVRGIINFFSSAAVAVDTLKVITCDKKIFNAVAEYGEICPGYILDNLKTCLEKSARTILA